MLAADLAALLSALPGRRPVVAVDGPDAAGKTTLADAVAAAAAVPVLRASVDGFLRPRSRRANLDAEGYYRSAFDLDALVRELLAPFAAGAQEVRTSVHDHVDDVAVDVRVAVPERAVLVLDGVYLLRPELRARWTLAVLLQVPPETTLARAAVRDRAYLGDRLEQRYRERYLPAWDLHEREARPAQWAHIIVAGDGRVVRWAPPVRAEPARRAPGRA